MSTDRNISQSLWQRLKPDVKGWTPFIAPQNGQAYFQDFPGEGIDIGTDGWWPFDENGLELAGDVVVSEGARIVVEGRFRPANPDQPAMLLMTLAGRFMYERIEDVIKIGFAIDGPSRKFFEFIDGKAVERPWKSCDVADTRVRCVAIGGILECDWIACAEVQV